MRGHRARVHIDHQPRYALPACNLLHLTASIMLGLQSGMPSWVCVCVGVCVEGAGGGGEQDVLQTLPVSFACINCKSCRFLRDEMASPWLFEATC